MKWKKILGFKNHSISENGEVRNDTTGKILKKQISTSGYYCLQLYNKGKILKYVHRLVGEAFIDNPSGKPQIDHIDGNKLNNDLQNLRWVTISENNLAYGAETRAKNRMIPVVATSPNGEQITFDSRKAVAEHFKMNVTKIKYNHLYKKSNAKGWLFKQV